MELTGRAAHPLSLGPPPVHLQFLEEQSRPSKHKGIRIRSLLRYGGGKRLNNRTFLPFFKNNSVIPATCCAAKATTSTGAAAGDMLEVDLREIKDKCRKWNWKGRYAINYFVSHSSSDPHSSNPNRPPYFLFMVSVPPFFTGAEILGRWPRVIPFMPLTSLGLVAQRSQ
ncbi:uncharacterized protein Pyn_14841 [Prunus yedoensis var. nudiflora]|uniref:Uncharacterized protein n=1 Tax=Prunus yedoensis var. nudiflora TaxID=2094558 RepID=A0A314YHE9_PRUYE|nr:uncharacterized protein Pyn_14841 [Prunus yedoensis var. nudiflora]